MQTEPKTQSGFTLLEIIIAVAVVGVLAAVALPSYGNYTRRAMASEGLSLAQPVLIKVREEVSYGEYTPSGPNFDRAAKPGSVALPHLSAMVKSVVRHDLKVVINYTVAFDPEGTTEYSLVMSGTLANDSVTWQCKSGPAAAGDLAAAAAGGVRVGVPMPTKWAPSGC